MYHFIKIKRFGTISCWYFVPKTDEEILEHWERFLSDNQDNIKLSYYTEGYYNGRARALEDVIDLISDTIEKAYNEQYK